jgi:hypothetical protein
MMGRLKSDQGQLFYEFRLGDAVPEDHLVRKISARWTPTRACISGPCPSAAMIRASVAACHSGRLCSAFGSFMM